MAGVGWSTMRRLRDPSFLPSFPSARAWGEGGCARLSAPEGSVSGPVRGRRRGPVVMSRAQDRAGFPSEETLRRWVDGLASDDEARARTALTALDRACRPHLLAAARPLVPDEMEAEDVVQDLVTRLWASRRRLRIEGSVRSYLMASIHHRCLKAMRWHERVEELPDEPAEVEGGFDVGGPSGLFGPEEAVYTLEVVEWFERELAELSEPDRQALRCKLRDFTYAEIGAFMGTSANAAKLRISRLRRKLHPLLRWLHDEAELV